MPSDEPLLEVENICTRYGPIQALHDISLSVHPGELVAIVGANGAGKTTLLHTLSGILRAEQGSIRFDGQEITRLPPHQVVKSGICQVPEGRQVFPPLSVEDNLRLGAYSLRREKNWVEQQLAGIYQLFPILQEKTGQSAGTLSGGQQQMLAIGRALLGRPRLLLLDEPSMGLAPLLVEEIFRVIQGLNEKGVTILLVEQKLNIALRISSRLYVMGHGKVVYEGTPKALMQADDIRAEWLEV